MIMFGDTSLKISKTVDLNKMYSLKIFIPDEFEITEPPIIVKKIKNK